MNTIRMALAAVLCQAAALQAMPAAAAAGSKATISSRMRATGSRFPISPAASPSRNNRSRAVRLDSPECDGG